MEEENRRERRKARREYMDMVRELVGFVKKRDKRVAKAQVGPEAVGGVGGKPHAACRQQHVVPSHF